MRILFLYTELAEYTMACLQALRKQKATIMVVHFPINPEAPFAFDQEAKAGFFDLSAIPDYASLEELVNRFQPDKIVCSGWINKWYLRICRKWSAKATCIITLDNHWNGGFKQQLMSILGKIWLSKWFKKIWVPGAPQKTYALRLGFPEQCIMTGFYTCDTERFEQMAADAYTTKNTSFPKVLLCVARYIPEKGYRELWSAFLQWQQESPNEWELWCAGAGKEFDQRVQHPKIKHLGFVQKQDWPSIISSTGVFILLSHFEPWGVVVQEFAAASYPLILSKQVGAGEAFLGSENGWTVASSQPADIVQVFKELGKKTDQELMEMAKKSQVLAMRLTPDSWATRLLEA
jgi:glycosyltransferase involved in cell wall biosynthesis